MERSGLDPIHHVLPEDCGQTRLQSDESNSVLFMTDHTGVGMMALAASSAGLKV